MPRKKQAIPGQVYEASATEEIAAAPEFGIAAADDLNPDDWEPGEIFASVSMVCVPLRRLRHKTTGETKVIELIPHDQQQVQRLALPIGLTHALALKVLGVIFSTFIPKSPTLARKAVASMNFAKDHLNFEALVGEDGTTRLVINEEALDAAHPAHPEAGEDARTAQSSQIN